MNDEYKLDLTYFLASKEKSRQLIGIIERLIQSFHLLTYELVVNL